MTDEAQVNSLKRRAEREASAIIARYGLSFDDLTLAAVAVGWIEGRQAGADEAREILRTVLDCFVATEDSAPLAVLHSVKVTP